MIKMSWRRVLTLSAIVLVAVVVGVGATAATGVIVDRVNADRDTQRVANEARDIESAVRKLAGVADADVVVELATSYAATTVEFEASGTPEVLAAAASDVYDLVAASDIGEMHRGGFRFTIEGAESRYFIGNVLPDVSPADVADDAGLWVRLLEMGEDVEVVRLGFEPRVGRTVQVAIPDGERGAAEMAAAYTRLQAALPEEVAQGRWEFTFQPDEAGDASDYRGTVSWVDGVPTSSVFATMVDAADVTQHVGVQARFDLEWSGDDQALVATFTVESGNLDDLEPAELASRVLAAPQWTWVKGAVDELAPLSSAGIGLEFAVQYSGWGDVHEPIAQFSTAECGAFGNGPLSDALADYWLASHPACAAAG